jgi:hypothetical protein
MGGLLRGGGRYAGTATYGNPNEDEGGGQEPELQRGRPDRGQRAGINASKLDKRQGECNGSDATGDNQPAWRDSSPPSQDHGATEPADCEQRHPQQLTDAAAVAVQRLVQQRDLVGRAAIRAGQLGHDGEPAQDSDGASEG